MSAVTVRLENTSTKRIEKTLELLAELAAPSELGEGCGCIEDAAALLHDALAQEHFDRAVAKRMMERQPNRWFDEVDIILAMDEINEAQANYFNEEN